MEKHDENYELMEREQRKHVQCVLGEANRHGVDVSAWELDEIELAFEKAFAVGFYHGKKCQRKPRLSLVTQ